VVSTCWAPVKSLARAKCWFRHAFCFPPRLVVAPCLNARGGAPAASCRTRRSGFRTLHGLLSASAACYRSIGSCLHACTFTYSARNALGQVGRSAFCAGLLADYLALSRPRARNVKAGASSGRAPSEPFVLVIFGKIFMGRLVGVCRHWFPPQGLKAAPDAVHILASAARFHGRRRAPPLARGPGGLPVNGLRIAMSTRPMSTPARRRSANRG